MKRQIVAGIAARGLCAVILVAYPADPTAGQAPAIIHYSSPRVPYEPTMAAPLGTGGWAQRWARPSWNRANAAVVFSGFSSPVKVATWMNVTPSASRYVAYDNPPGSVEASSV